MNTSRLDFSNRSTSNLQQQEQPPNTLAMEQQQIIMNNYERAPDSLVDCFSLISVDLEDDCCNPAVVGLETCGGANSTKAAANAAIANNQILQRQVEALQMKLKRSEEEKDALRKEKAAQRRELSNLRKCLKSNHVVQELRKKVEYYEVERDYFVREVRMLEDKIDELEKINDAKTCQLHVFDKLFRAMETENNNANNNNNAVVGGEISKNLQGQQGHNQIQLQQHRRCHSDYCCSNNNGHPPDTITLSTTITTCCSTTMMNEEDDLDLSISSSNGTPDCCEQERKTQEC